METLVTQLQPYALAHLEQSWPVRGLSALHAMQESILVTHITIALDVLPECTPLHLQHSAHGVLLAITRLKIQCAWYALLVKYPRIRRLMSAPAVRAALRLQEPIAHAHPRAALPPVLLVQADTAITL